MIPNTDEDDFDSLQVEESGYRPQKPNNSQRQATADAASLESEYNSTGMSDAARAFATMNEKDRAIDNDYKRAQTQSVQLQNKMAQARMEISPRMKRALKRVENRDAEKKRKENIEAEKKQSRQDFWDRGTPGKEAWGHQRDRGDAVKEEQLKRQERANKNFQERVTPIREREYARQERQKLEAERMQDPQARTDWLVGQPGVNYAKIGDSQMKVAPNSAAKKAFANYVQNRQTKQTAFGQSGEQQQPSAMPPQVGQQQPSAMPPQVGQQQPSAMPPQVGQQQPSAMPPQVDKIAPRRAAQTAATNTKNPLYN